MTDKEIQEFMEHASSTNEILKSISALSEKMDQNQTHADEKEKQRFLITTIIAALSFIAGAVAAVAAILALIESHPF